MPTEKNTQQMLDLFFPSQLANKKFAYMPADGADCPQKYKDLTRNWAESHDAKYFFIDNSLEGPLAQHECTKLLECNILAMAGGNTFTLLRNLRRSGLDRAISVFVEKPDYVLGGYSAGALVLTPNIRIAGIGDFDENLVGLTDTTGLDIVDFELFPHYEEKWEQTIVDFEFNNKTTIKRISNDDIVVLEL
jgi:dipeptidase E